MREMESEKTALDEVLAFYAGHAEFFNRPPEDANAVGSENSILNIASYKGNLGHVKLLVSNGANLNFQGDMGNTPLHDATSSGSQNVVEFLLKAGSDPKIRNEFGNTALDDALARGNRKIASIIRKAMHR